MRIVCALICVAMVVFGCAMPADLCAQWAYNIGGSDLACGFDIAVDGSGNV